MKFSFEKALASTMSCVEKEAPTAYLIKTGTDKSVSFAVIGVRSEALRKSKDFRTKYSVGGSSIFSTWGAVSIEAKGNNILFDYAGEEGEYRYLVRDITDPTTRDLIASWIEDLRFFVEAYEESQQQEERAKMSVLFKR